MGRETNKVNEDRLEKSVEALEHIRTQVNGYLNEGYDILLGTIIVYKYINGDYQEIALPMVYSATNVHELMAIFEALHRMERKITAENPKESELARFLMYSDKHKKNIGVSHLYTKKTQLEHDERR